MQPTQRTTKTADNFTIGLLELVSGNSENPLLICLPGGSYTAEYFDVPGLSMMQTAAAAGFDVIALDRPNYGASDELSREQTTFARNAEVLDDAVAQLWAQHGGTYPGVVVIGHSIGGAIAVHIAAMPTHEWPLLGISVSAVNELSPEHVVDAWRSIPVGIPVEFSNEQRRTFMYGPGGSFDTDAIERASIAASPMPLEELLEIVGGWLYDVQRLGSEVRVPVQYALPEFDQLWVVSQERVDAFAGRFSAAPLIDATLARGVGHSLDHHSAAGTWHERQLAFAQECVQIATQTPT
jgi:pimeloyl-ACP methyl ester carboxylesterase